MGIRVSPVRSVYRFCKHKWRLTLVAQEWLGRPTSIRPFSSLSAAFAPAPNKMERGVISVLGATGTGKSKLAIELAKAYNGEIVNCDALQVYEGLDVTTNKVSEAERRAAPHHLIGTVPALSEYTVIDFRDDALRVINDIHERGKVPILCGGTCYYYEAVMYESLLDDGTGLETSKSAEDRLVKEEDMESHAVLSAVDPASAKRLHPNERRKIRRALEVYSQTGEPYSAWLEKQKANGPRKLRFSKALTIWLDCDLPALDARLDARVDVMMTQGALEEMVQVCTKVHKDFNAGSAPDFTRGVMQNIGIKEMYPYIRARYLGNTGGDQQPHSGEELARLYADCLEGMKRATRRYVRKQLSWLRNRFGVPVDQENDLAKLGTSAYLLYILDATDLEHWQAHVYDRASHLGRTFLNGAAVDMPDPVEYSSMSASLSQQLTDLRAKKRKLQAIDIGDSGGEDVRWKTFTCAACNRVLHGETEWRIHLASRAHRKREARKKNFDEYKARIAKGQVDDDGVAS